MMFLEWDDEYNIGIEEFDRQHRKLFKCINNICTAVSSDEEQGAVRKVLAELLNYTRVHFRDEEVNLMMYDVPGFAEHKSEHDRLAREVTEYALNFASDPKLAEHVLAFLKKWILFHIFDMDKNYTDYLKDKDIIIWE